MKKIAICGFNLESNRFASPCDRRDFEEHMYNISNFSSIIEKTKVSVGEFELGIFKIKVNKVKTYEKDLIVCES